MAGFFEAVTKNTKAWEEMSEASLKRIKEKYTCALLSPLHATSSGSRSLRKPH